MTPMMSLFLRLLLAILLFVALFALSDYAMAATPLPQAQHDVLRATGPQSAHILDLWRVFLAACTFVFAAILVALIVAIRRAPRADEVTPPDLERAALPEPGPRRGVMRAVFASSLALIALIVASVFTDRALARMSLADALDIEVTAHQWWWTARYIDKASPSREFTVANELHIPVGRPVVIELHADDVIHSLWLPNLAGKKDLIPGRSTTLQLRADQPGIYRGQCAEFCGLQHAMMGLLVVAEPAPQYLEWAAAQRLAPAPPQDAKARHGMQLFQSVSCAMCHAIQGTEANARHAPDLTHVASRQTLAAGTFANTPQNLAQWIADPQKFKPGTNMPATPMSRDDLDAIVAYLGTLK